MPREVLIQKTKIIKKQYNKKQLKIKNKSEKQKINNIQTTGKQRLNRRLRKKYKKIK
jgi:hypothetical protein